MFQGKFHRYRAILEDHQGVRHQAVLVHAILRI
jgi:hypothetical protein